MAVDFAQEYLGSPPVNPMEQYPAALRKKKPAPQYPPYGGQGMDLTSGIADPMAAPPPQPAVQQPSLAPGVQAAAPQGQIGDTRFGSDYSQAKFNMDMLAGEDETLQDQGALIESLRGGKHKTAIGGAMGAATDMLATAAALKNLDKRSALKERSVDEMRKSRFRNSATNGLEVDPTRDF
jgi:hypothetical protein